jgi:hypothetical protein
MRWPQCRRRRRGRSIRNPRLGATASAPPPPSLAGSQLIRRRAGGGSIRRRIGQIFGIGAQASVPEQEQG